MNGGTKDNQATKFAEPHFGLWKTTFSNTVPVFKLIPIFFYTCSASHPAVANEASAGAWTNMAFSSPAQTTVEGTSSVKTWRAAATTTTTSEPGGDHPPPHPPPQNHHVTQGPRLLSESLLNAPPSVHFKSFVFSNWKKRKKKIKTKGQAEQKTPVTFFFSFLYCCWPSTYLRMRVKVPEDLLDPLTVAHGTPWKRRARWLQIHENIYTQWIYFYRSWGFQYNTFHGVN